MWPIAAWTGDHNNNRNNSNNNINNHNNNHDNNLKNNHNIIITITITITITWTGCCRCCLPSLPCQRWRRGSVGPESRMGTFGLITVYLMPSKCSFFFFFSLLLLPPSLPSPPPPPSDELETSGRIHKIEESNLIYFIHLNLFLHS